MQFDVAGASELEEALPLAVGHPPGKPVTIFIAGATGVAARTYMAFIGFGLTFNVPAVPGATRYEWTFEHVQQHTKQVISTDVPSVQWAPPKSGHFLVTARACNSNGCSVGALSTDNGFWIHAWPSPPQF